MIEVYAFFMAFMVQILVVSVLQPKWFSSYIRAKAEAQPLGWSPQSRERFLGLARTANIGIAVLGLAMLGWLFNYMRNPDWDIISVKTLVAAYVAVQMVPLILLSLFLARAKKRALLQSPPEARRTASLQRRGLFDIVSPFTVFLAVLVYVLFAAFMVYLQRHPAIGLPGYRLLGMVTLVFAWSGFFVYWQIYRRKKWPLETRAYRMQAVEVGVKVILYTTITAVLFMSLNFALMLADLVRWAPFTMSAYFVIVVLIARMQFVSLRRQAEADRP